MDRPRMATRMGQSVPPVHITLPQRGHVRRRGHSTIQKRHTGGGDPPLIRWPDTDRAETGPPYGPRAARANAGSDASTPVAAWDGGWLDRSSGLAGRAVAHAAMTDHDGLASSFAAHVHAPATTWPGPATRPNPLSSPTQSATCPSFRCVVAFLLNKKRTVVCAHLCCRF